MKSFIFLLIMGTFTFFSSWLDLSLSAFFYDGRAFSPHIIWEASYRYAIWPAWGVVAAALIWGAISWKQASPQGMKGAVYLVLVFALGAGLIIHGLFKEHWGRPRPRQIEAFGGKQSFHPYYWPNFSSKQESAKSFPCGHASCGFYFFAFIWLGRVMQWPSLASWGWCLSFSLGGLLSIGRIAQGGHFLSDTVGSAAVMWGVSQGLAYLIFKKELNKRRGILLIVSEERG